MAGKKNMMTVSIDPEQVMHTQISRSKNGYNSARMVVKSGENEYMAISYEWEGESVPDFVMGMMGFMQANEMTVGTVESYAEEYAAKMKKKPVMDEEDEEDMPDSKNKTGKKKKC